MKKAEAENLNSYGDEVIPPKLAVKAMRDSGYKNTAYAIAELIDNSVQAEADLVEVFCIENKSLVREKELKRLTEIGVLDNGTGMDGITLCQALQFGNGSHLEDRKGIGRFGMGLPNASISQCRRVDVWTWQHGPQNAIRSYLDVDEIENGHIRNVPEPFAEPLPEEWENLSKEIGTHGTLVIWSKFDEHRLTWKSGRTTLAHTENQAGRMYRKFINSGKLVLRLVAIDGENNGTLIDREAQVNDPLYLMAPSSTPAPFDATPMFQKWGEKDDEFEIEYGDIVAKVSVRFSWAKQDTVPKDGTDRGRTLYGKHAAKNVGVSIVRAGRELELDAAWAVSYDPTERWWGVEIEFPPQLDEVFGVTNNKQAATVFSHMSKFNWEEEAESGEKYMDFTRRLREEEDPRAYLIEIVEHIKLQLSQIRNRLKDQTKGIRSGNKRHDEPSIEDKATKQWKDRSKKGYSAKIDDESFNEKAREELVDDLVKNKHYPDEVAREIVEAIEKRDRKIIFVTAEVDSQSFFQIETRAGGITEIIFNTRHPAYEKLVKALDTDISGSTDSDLVDRIENASDTLKLLFAAWARYEEEDVPLRETIRDIRHEWGKMAKNFIGEEA